MTGFCRGLAVAVLLATWAVTAGEEAADAVILSPYRCLIGGRRRRLPRSQRIYPADRFTITLPVECRRWAKDARR